EAMSIGIPSDLIAEDLRQCLSHLAEITGGEITTNEVLGNIFSHFCIGK
ncbi:MAG: tRNA uridine-5-carboxymethylaminomethyl(34) synthesis GTPase MnmE, partial [Prevotella sp.]|nr:tRNA uridine-5-carboxymethylaminomethyl(34) synthesis GTPase MnmE [Prevotella sp.]